LVGLAYVSYIHNQSTKIAELQREITDLKNGKNVNIPEQGIPKIPQRNGSKNTNTTGGHRKPQKDSDSQRIGSNKENNSHLLNFSRAVSSNNQLTGGGKQEGDMQPILQQSNAGPLTSGASDDGFIEVQKRKSKRPELVGTAVTADNKCSLKAAKRTAHVYIGNLDSTTTDSLREYITTVTEVSENELDIEKLNTKSKHSSFRVSLPYDNLDSIKKPELWNKGAILNRYFFPKQNISNPLNLIKNQ
jgi:hypothetical protein